MILNSTSKSITIVLGEGISSVECDVTISYADLTTTSYIDGAVDSTTNGTTPVTIVSAPAASTQRRVKQITIFNNDVVSHTVTVKYIDGANSRIVWQGTVLSDQLLAYGAEVWNLPNNVGPTGATGAASTVPGPQGPPGIALDGVDGEDGLPIPGSMGETGATGAASTVPGPTGPPGIALDGIDGEDGLTIPGLLPNVTATLSVGYTFAPNNIGTVSSGTTTPNPALGNYQYLSNNGAFTLAAPSIDCAIDILVTNAGSAGAITFSGFTVGSNTGDALTTTNTNKFLISIRRINSVSLYGITALQ